MLIVPAFARDRRRDPWQIVLTCVLYAWANAVLQVWILWRDVEGNRMKKSTSGVCIVAGPILCILGGGIAQKAVSHNPADDAYYDMIHAGGVGLAIIGLLMFFFGCMWFSKKS